MLDAISCWRVDWSAIGAVATAAAVGASLWISGSEHRRRKKYARFLLAKDCGSLRALVLELREYATFLDYYFAGEDVSWNEDERHSKLIEKRISQLQYFGHSEQLFSYQDDGKAFDNLSRAVGSASSVLESAIRVWRLEEQVDHADAVVAFIREVAKDLEDALNAYPVGEPAA